MCKLCILKVEEEMTWPQAQNGFSFVALAISLFYNSPFAATEMFTKEPSETIRSHCLKNTFNGRERACALAVMLFS